MKSFCWDYKKSITTDKTPILPTQANPTTHFLQSKTLDTSETTIPEGDTMKKLALSDFILPWAVSDMPSYLAWTPTFQTPQSPSHR